MYKTITVREKDIDRKWYVVDAEGQILGRLASRLALILRGKHKPIFSPHLDTGDHVVIVNAAKILLTANKLENKTYVRHSGYPGGLKSRTAAQVKAAHPERLIRMAIQGMLPKNKLGRAVIKKLHIFAGAEHDHQAQRPEALDPVRRRTRS